MDSKCWKNEKEIPCCCICGDVGFSDALLPCSQCAFRLQHTYCSRYYPEKIEIENWSCEWCIHEKEEFGEEKKKKKKMKMDPIIERKEELQRAGPGKNGGSKAVDRWRKLAKAAKMGTAKRYKLLSDVICSSQL